jgi:hypothetical protein
MPKKGKGGKGGKKAAEADPDDLGCSPDNLKKNYERICKYGPVALNRLPSRILTHDGRLLCSGN